MRSKAAARAAREVNRMLDPELEVLDERNAEQTRKYGKTILPKQRDFHRILAVFNDEMRRNGVKMPRDVSAAHYSVIGRILALSQRNVDELGMAQCPQCRKAVEPVCHCPTCNTQVEVLVPNAKLEQNTIKALEMMLDRMAPKLATVTNNINIHQTIMVLTNGIAGIITEFVPPERRLEAQLKIRTLIESHKHASATEAATEG